MAATRYEARSVAREPDGGTPGRLSYIRPPGREFAVQRIWRLCRIFGIVQLFAEQEIKAVMTESPLVEHALIEQLLDSLRELPDVHAELDRSEPAVQAAGRIDAKIDLHIAGKSIVLLVEAKKSVFPRDVRQALWQLKSLQQGPSYCLT